jgi:rieske iron-sulfur protein
MADCSNCKHALLPSQQALQQAPDPESSTRRKLLQLTAGVAVGITGLSPAIAFARPAGGDRLVLEDAEGAPAPLRVQDIPMAGKPVLAFPFTPATKAIKDDSRLNKIVLMRFAESDLDAETKKRAVKGVVAYSAICTHQACDVKTWVAKDKALVCFCHSSQFLLLESAKVNGGPAPRALPGLPLAEEGGQLVITGPFTGKPGGSA